jgi:hypothetical protein
LSSSFEGVSKNAQQLSNWFYLIKEKYKGETKGEKKEKQASGKTSFKNIRRPAGGSYIWFVIRHMPFALTFHWEK